MVEVRSISFCMPILKANTYNLKKSTHFYLLYEESYNRLKLTYFSRTSAFTLDAHCTQTNKKTEKLLNSYHYVIYMCHKPMII